MHIIKASGEKELFKEEKIRSSSIRAGASKKLADETIKRVKEKVRSGMSSDKIYDHVLKCLRKKEPIVAVKYSLKRAIMALGPTGFPFERYVAEILKEYGYSVKVGQIVKGYCVNHEVDVIAQKGNRHFMVECKYHNRPGTRSDLKVALYIYSRFLDIVKSWKQKPGHSQKFHQAWLVTNTKVTSEAIKFSRCVGLNVIAWRYPSHQSLENLIEEKKLYPITILPSLSRDAKEKLYRQKLVSVKSLLKYSPRDLVRLTKIQSNVVKKLQKEAKQLLYTNNSILTIKKAKSNFVIESVTIKKDRKRSNFFKIKN